MTIGVHLKLISLLGIILIFVAYEGVGKVTWLKSPAVRKDTRCYYTVRVAVN
jgi:hypothetical protein